METKSEYEFQHLRICEKWLQRESCRKCLFEILCNYEKMKKSLNDKQEKHENIDLADSLCNANN